MNGFKVIGCLCCLIAATSLSAQVPNAGLKSGTGSAMEIADNATIAIPVFTAEGWVYANSGGLLVTRDVSSGTPSDWQLWYDGANNRLAFITAKTPPDQYFYTPVGSFLKGRWYHFAVTASGPAGWAKVYIDGNLIISPTFTSRQFNASTGLCWAGYYNNPGGAYLDGYMDELRYWNRIRTQQEIVAAKDSALSLNDRQGLRGYWRFCLDFADSSGYGNHGTAQGNAQVVTVTGLPFGFPCEPDPCASISVEIDADLLNCVIDSTVLTASTGFAQYRWSTGDTTRSITVRAPGRYILTVWDTLGCEAADTVNVVFSPDLSIDGDLLKCGIDSTVLTANAGFAQYRWSTGDTTRSITVRAPGRYILTVRDTLGCEAADTVDVVFSPDLSVDVGSDLLLCDGAVGQLTAQVAGGTLPHTFKWSTGESTQSITVSAAGLYIVTVTDMFGCESTDSVFVDFVARLEVDAGADLLLCEGDTVELNVFFSGGLDPYTVQWSPATGLSNEFGRPTYASPDTSTMYIVTVTDVIGCVGIDSVLVTVNPAPQVFAGDDVEICLGDSVRLHGYIADSTNIGAVLWQPPDGLSDPFAINPVAHPTQTTLYILTVFDLAGCPGRDSVLVTVLDSPELILPDEVIRCKGDSVQLLLSINGGGGPFTVHWDPPEGLSSITVFRPVASPDSTTVYYVTVTDRAGCMYYDSVTVIVIEPDPPELVADGPLRFCLGDSVTLRITRQYLQYRWLTPAGEFDGGQTRVVRDAGIYAVVVIDSNGCELISNPLEVIVDTLAGPPITIMGGTCEGDTIYLSTTGGYAAYNWLDKDGNIIGSDTVLIVTRSGAFQLQTADSNGCIAVSELLAIRFSPLPEPDPTGLTVVCIGTVADYRTARFLNRSYKWRVIGGDLQSADDGTFITVHWQQEGKHFVEVTETIDSSGCSATAILEVLVVTTLHPVIRASGPLVFCESDSLILSTDEYDTVLWSRDTIYPYASGSTLVVKESGRYSVHVSDGNGCDGDSDTLEVRVIPRPTADFDAPLTACAGDTLLFVATDVSADSCIWEIEGNAVVLDSSGCMLRIVCGADGGVLVRLLQSTRVNDSLLCSSEAEKYIRIEPLPEPVLSVTGPLVFCEGDSVLLSTQPGYERYIWDTPIGTIDTTAEAIRAGTSGRYSVTVISAAGCVGVSNEIVLTVLPMPDARIFGPVSVCVNDTSSYYVTGSAGESIRWTVIGGNLLTLDSLASIDVHWPVTGDGMIIVRVGNEYCEAIDTLHVSIADSLLPVIVADGPLVFCEGESVLLDAGAGFVTYQWTTPAGQDTGRYVLAAMAGEYYVFVRGLSGCSGTSDPVVITVLPLPAPLIVGPDTVCVGDTVMLSVEPEYLTYRWSTGETTRAISVSSSDTYSVEVTDSTGCTGTAIHNLVVVPLPDKPVITLSDDTLHSTPAHAYQWYFEDSPINGAVLRDVKAIDTGYYRVRVFNEAGCTILSDPFPYFIERVKAFATVMLPEVTAAPGDKIDIPLTLLTSENLDAIDARKFEARIRYRNSLLAPRDGTSTGAIEGSDRVISLEGESITGSNELAILSFTATLGDMESTPLDIEHFAWTDAEVTVTKIDGVFYLEVCREGGARLFEDGGSFGLSQNTPNPFNAQTRIAYCVIEAGRVRLLVFDMLGRIVRVLKDHEQMPGSYVAVFDAGVLPSGTYVYVLQTPNLTAQKMMQIVK